MKFTVSDGEIIALLEAHCLYWTERCTETQGALNGLPDLPANAAQRAQLIATLDSQKLSKDFCMFIRTHYNDKGQTRELTIDEALFLFDPLRVSAVMGR